MTSLQIAGDGPVQQWWLNRPSARNALDPELVKSLHRALLDAEADSRARVIVISGRGPSFCAGADLHYLYGQGASGKSPIPFLRAICDLTLAMEDSRLLFVAAVHGHAIAGGIELALACDFVVAAEDSRFGDGHVLNNLTAGGGASHRLSAKLGVARARHLALTGDQVVALDLMSSGWISRLATSEELQLEANRLAVQLCRPSQAAQVAYKRLLTGSAREATASGLRRELEAFENHWRSNDVASALKAFLERKRLEKVDG